MAKEIASRVMVFEDDPSTQLLVKKQVEKIFPHGEIRILNQVYTAALEIEFFQPHAVIMDFHFGRHTSQDLIPYLAHNKIETYFYTSSPEDVRRLCRRMLGKTPKNIHVYSKQSDRPAVFNEIKKYIRSLECLKH